MRLFFTYTMETEGAVIIREMYLFLPGEAAPKEMKTSRGVGYRRDEVEKEYLIYFINSPDSETFVRPLPGCRVGEIRIVIQK